MFQLWSWDMKNEDPFARRFFKQTKTTYWFFSVCNFRVLSFHLRNLALSQAQKPHYILEACFIALIITSYYWWSSSLPLLKETGVGKKMGLYVVGMCLEMMNPLMGLIIQSCGLFFSVILSNSSHFTDFTLPYKYS